MRLIRSFRGPRAGRRCPSDYGIEFVRLARGWRVEVRRPPRRRVERHLAKNLAQATAWAKEHWRPEFLERLVEGLAADHVSRQLHRDAVHGDPVALLALLDATEERGVQVDRFGLISQARRERLFPGDVPATAEERAEQVRLVRARADILAEVYAKMMYEKRRSMPFGAQRFRDLYPYYENLACLRDPHLRQRCRQTIRAGLAALGLRAVAEASYSLDGPNAGYTMAIVYWCPSGDFRDIGRKDLEGAIHEVIVGVYRELGVGIAEEG